ncbi:MAG TPA: MFS transporter, partial [Chloroflexota bacterium]
MALSLARLLNSPLAHGFALTFARPVYRTIFLVLLALGTNAGIFLSYTSLWARTVLDATPGLASVLFLAYGLAGSVGNTLLGIWSDRLRRRVPLIVGSTATASLAVASMAFIPSFPLAVVACALAGVNAFSPTLALASDHVRHDASLPSATAPVVIATERMAWSLGILIGPAIAAALLALTASFPSLYLTGALCIASGTLLALHLEDAPGTTGAPVHHGPARRALPA